MTESQAVGEFTAALNTINAALAAHGDEQPYKAIIEASDRILGDARIGVAVYESDASSPFDYFTIRFRDGSFELISHGKEKPDVAWRVSRDYLERVAANPGEYVEHPVKLDWDWLKSRIGLAD